MIRGISFDEASTKEHNNLEDHMLPTGTREPAAKPIKRIEGFQHAAANKHWNLPQARKRVDY
jgi:hypothetical protein